LGFLFPAASPACTKTRHQCNRNSTLSARISAGLMSFEWPTSTLCNGPSRLSRQNFWREIVILPDVGLQELRVVGQMIKDPNAHARIAPRAVSPSHLKPSNLNYPIRYGSNEGISGLAQAVWREKLIVSAVLARKIAPVRAMFAAAIHRSFLAQANQPSRVLMRHASAS
jgi:hypothetical protein